MAQSCQPGVKVPKVLTPKHSSNTYLDSEACNNPRRPSVRHSQRPPKRRKLGKDAIIISPGESETEPLSPTENILTSTRRKTKKKTTEHLAPPNPPPTAANPRRVGTSDRVFDPVIEQHYSDPYERIDPDGPTPDRLRRTNLENALRNQGFSFHRSIVIANWLMVCNGHYRQFGARNRARYRRRRATRQPVPSTSESPAPNTEREQDSALNQDSHESDIQNSNDSEENSEDESDADSGTEADEEEDLGSGDDDDDEEEAMTAAQLAQETQEIEKLLDLGPVGTKHEAQTMSVRSNSVGDSKDRDIEDLKMRLRRSLHIYQIVYGDQLPPPNPKIVYMQSNRHSIPRAIIPGGIRSQGHHPLQETILPDDRIVLTEDPTLGISQFSATLHTAVVEKNLSKEQSSRQQVRHDPEAAEEIPSWVRAAEKQEFSSGYREIWKELQEEERSKEAELKESVDAEAGIESVSKPKVEFKPKPKKLRRVRKVSFATTFPSKR